MKPLHLKVVCLLLMVRHGDSLLSEATEIAVEVMNFASEGLVDRTKSALTNAEQVIMGSLSTACEPMKNLLKMQYTDMKTMGDEPQLETLKITVLSSKGLQWHPISEANSSIIKLINMKKKTLMYVHGFIDDPSGLSFSTVSKAFFSRGDYNILALDCSSLIRWLYLRATVYVRFIAEKLGAVLVELVKGGVPLEDILVTGHSLGSHIAGLAGKKFYELTGKLIHIIIGLDPAGPCFSKMEKGMSTDSAEHVVAFHTNGGMFGMKEPIGHVDFYPNGGESQPGCLDPVSDHNRSWKLFAECARHDTVFLARKCKDYTTFCENACGDTTIGIMGLNFKSSTRGVFYLRTAGSSPYALGERGLYGSNSTVSGDCTDGNIVAKYTNFLGSL